MAGGACHGFIVPDRRVVALHTILIIGMFCFFPVPTVRVVAAGAVLFVMIGWLDMAGAAIAPRRMVKDAISPAFGAVTVRALSAIMINR